LKFTITGEEKKALLSDALETILAKLEKRGPRYKYSAEMTRKMNGADTASSSALFQKCGAFVTLHKKAGTERRLRGCIGRMTSEEPLIKTVRTMALEAAFDDPRFPPLSKSELPLCDIEISVLSPMELITDPRTVRVGVHGLYLAYGGRAGVFLPQVPVEQGWNLDQYLEGICQKAGLPPGTYKLDGANLYTFTAEVFGSGVQ
jgi:AmmeMemoRadiSam system protein A